jgi:uncharacterized delta-60 repeat protein
MRDVFLKSSFSVVFTTAFAALSPVVLAGCTNNTPLVELLEHSGIESKLLLISPFTPSTNPTNNTADKSVAVSGSAFWIATKTVIVSGADSCATADYSQATATKVPVTVTVPTATEGTYKVCALGQKITGEWQDPADAVASEVLTVDTTAPVDASFFSNDPDYLNTGFTVQIAFSEAVQPLNGSSLTLTNATLLTIVPLSASSYVITVIPLTEGTVSVQLNPANILDLAGNTFGNGAMMISRIYDATAPSAPSIQINGGAVTTNVATATLTLSATGSPDQMYITTQTGCAAGGSWEPYATTKTWALTPNATNNVYVKYRDAALNESSCAGASIVHDDIRPVVTFTTAAASYVRDSVDLDINLSEPLASFSESLFSYVNVAGRGTLSGGGLFYHLSVVPNGDGPVSVTLPSASIVDAAGNTATSSATLTRIADRTAPSSVGALSLGSVPQILTSSPAITFSAASDATSGVQGYEARIVQGTTEVAGWIPMSSGASYNGLSLAENADYTLQVRAIDNAGNAGPAASANWRTYQSPYTLLPWTLAPNYEVLAIEQQASGKILVGGSFTGFTDLAGFSKFGTKVAADGTRVAAFNAGQGFDGAVTTSVALSDGSVVVGGVFTHYRGLEADFIAHILADGSLDTTFSAGGGFDLPVYTIVEVAGSYVIGGDFTSYRGFGVGGIAKLDAQGNLLPSFTTGSGFDGRVNALGVTSNGDIVVGGSFANYNGLAAPRLAMLTPAGARESTGVFYIGSGFSSGDVLALEILSDDSIVVGGSFLTFQGSSSFSRLLLLNKAGVRDASFAPSFAPNNNVVAITAVDDSHIFVGGTFTTYNALPHQGLIMIDKTGAVTSSFVSNGGVNGSVGAIARSQFTSDVFVGGSFTEYEGTSVAPSLLRLSLSGAVVPKNFAVGPGNANAVAVQTIAAFNDDAVFVGGAFESYGFTAPSYFAQLTPDSHVPVITFAAGASNFNGAVKALALQSNGSILVSGAFTAYGASSTPGFARLNYDGSADSNFNSNLGTGPAGGSVQRALQLGNGTILLAGDFVSFNGDFVNFNAAALTDTGMRDTSWLAQGANAAILDIAQQSTGRVLMVGDFTTFNASTAHHLSATYGTGANFGMTDISFNNAGFDGQARRLAVQDNDAVVVTGSFTHYGAVSVPGLVRVSANGTIDTSFQAKIGTGPDSDVLDLHWNTANRTLLLVGSFENFDGHACHNIVRLKEDGSIDTSFNVDTGFDGTISTAKILANGDIAIGGLQFNYLGAATYNFSVLHPPAN